MLLSSQGWEYHAAQTLHLRFFWLIPLGMHHHTLLTIVFWLVPFLLHHYTLLTIRAPVAKLQGSLQLSDTLWRTQLHCL